MLDSKHILLATTNAAKLAKLRWLLDGLGLETVAPSAPFAVPEVGQTHQENAEDKAQTWSQQFEMTAIASDGGLVIPALGERWDTMLTARFAGPAATDRDRADRLLELMRPYRGQQRTAHWREAVAVASGGKVLASWAVESRPGVLAEGYDPPTFKPGFWAFNLWSIPEVGKTYNQLTPEELEALEDHWRLLRNIVQHWVRENRGESLG